MLHRATEPVKDLEILFDSKVKLDCQINNIINRTNKIFGLMNRNCANFTDKHAFNSLIVLWYAIYLGKWLNNKVFIIKLSETSYISIHSNIPHSPYSLFLSIPNLETLDNS